MIISLKCWERRKFPVSVKWQVTVSLSCPRGHSLSSASSHPDDRVKSWHSSQAFSHRPLLTCTASHLLRLLKHLSFCSLQALWHAVLSRQKPSPPSALAWPPPAHSGSALMSLLWDTLLTPQVGDAACNGLFSQPLYFPISLNLTLECSVFLFNYLHSVCHVACAQ